jgi:cyclic pyranopterin phosphate synthase
MSGPQSRIIPLIDVRKHLPPLEESMAHADAPLADSFGRPVRDLRISVTDRCNFRCTYCMPKDVFGPDYPHLRRAELLSFEEIERVARLFVSQGVCKIRLTGGEPLLRKHIENLIEILARIPGIELTLTTNGSLLPKKAQALRDAGLDRLTVSLDALDDTVFRAMNDVDFPVAKVLEGIDAAESAGFGPIKINMVVKKGTNDQEIVPMARQFRGSGHIVRFIEFMDVGCSNGWNLDQVVPSAEVVARIHDYYPLASQDPNYTGEVAERWRYLDGGGEIGVISSVTQAFCHTCTRIRMSTEGKLFTCLFATDGYDIRALLRDNRSDDDLLRAIRAVWRHRDDRYSEIRTAETARQRKVEMSYIGG